MIFRPWFCALATGLVLPLPGHAQPATDVSSLTRAAEGFYTAYRTIPPGGIPDIDARAKLEPFLSPALDKLLGEGETAQMRYAKATKNMSPPLIEGDLFTSLFEGATSFKVGACLSDGRGGHCQVTLGYVHGQDKPLAWTDTVYLVRVGSGWGVDDIAYGASWAFGNKGRLTSTLKDAIRDGEAAAE